MLISVAAAAPRFAIGLYIYSFSSSVVFFKGNWQQLLPGFNQNSKEADWLWNVKLLKTLPMGGWQDFTSDIFRLLCKVALRSGKSF